MEAPLPDDINGNNSLPAGYKAVTGQKVLASQHNPPLEDLSSCMTARLPRNGTAPMLANLPMGGFKITGAGAGTASTDLVTKAQMDSVLPVGSVVDFAGPVAPAGWLLCYGQLVSRTEYASLFAAIGVNYSAGDGSTTFGVPDLRGRVTAGKDDMGGTDAGRLSTFFGAAARTLGGVLGAASHVLTLLQIPAHDHGGATGFAGEHSHTLPGATSNTGSGSVGGSGTGSLISTSTAPDHRHTIAAAGGDAAHPNAQPTAMMNKIIKAV